MVVIATPPQLAPPPAPPPALATARAPELAIVPALELIKHVHHHQS